MSLTITLQTAASLAASTPSPATVTVATGLPGPQGLPGQAATITVGSVTAVPWGTAPTVTNSGTSSAAIFNFQLETGPQGTQGIQGVPGPKGDAGSPGAGATVTVGSVTAVPYGSTTTVTNVGTSTNAIFNFQLQTGPQGAQGVKGDTGSQGPAGQGVPTGGSAGQVLAKIDGTNYNTQWITSPSAPVTSVAGKTGAVTLTASDVSGVAPINSPTFTGLVTIPAGASISGYATQGYVTSQGYITSSALSPYLLSSTAASTYQTQSGMSAYLTTASASAIYQTQAAMSAYLTSATAASTYAPLARGIPASGATGQVLTKNSGTNYDVSWTTPAVGDKYYTTSTTSLSVSNGIKNLTVATGLSYTTQQDIIIAYNAGNHMHAVVVSYNPATGAMVADVAQHTGTGTYSAWTVNVGGISSVAEWGLITGTLSNQTDLQTALNAKYDASNPSGYISAAPNDGNYYIQQNGSWTQLIVT